MIDSIFALGLQKQTWQLSWQSISLLRRGSWVRAPARSLKKLSSILTFFLPLTFISRTWRNWQTRQLEGLVGIIPVEVRVFSCAHLYIFPNIIINVSIGSIKNLKFYLNKAMCSFFGIKAYSNLMENKLEQQNRSYYKIAKTIQLKICKKRSSKANSIVFCLFLQTI